jgi:hypothetical protein
MSVITITGRPGFGKTLNLTNECRINFKNDNPFLKRLWTEKILRKKYIYSLNDYSNYPILLKESKKPLYFLNDKGEIETYFDEETKTYKIYSWQVRLFDMTIRYKYNETARFYIDEIQAMYDSMDYKDFPDCIAHFFQAHRHMEYNDIYVNSQSLSRIIKRVLVISEVYWNIQSFTKILGFCICSYRISWDLASGNETKVINEGIADIDYRTRIFRAKPVYKMYKTKYLKGLLEKAEMYPHKMWDSLIMHYDDIMNNFFPTDEEREELKKARY